MMAEEKNNGAEKRFDYLEEMAEEVGRKQERKLEASRDTRNTIWFGVGMFGLVGWSVMLPTVGGCMLGMWVDKHFPSRYSWTLMLLLLGLLLGCFTAWRWVEKEGRERDKLER